MKNNTKISVEDKIKKSIEKVRPSLRADGGDVEFREWDAKKGVLKVEFKGMCVGCPMSQFTLKDSIEKVVKEDVEEVKEVVSI